MNSSLENPPGDFKLTLDEEGAATLHFEGRMDAESAPVMIPKF